MKKLLLIVIVVASLTKQSQAQIITTVAGNGTNGYTGDNGQATVGELGNPYSVAFDAAGNLYIADEGNNRIRKVNAAGVISTFAGNGTFGFSGDGGAATAAELSYPAGMTFDAVGNLYIADASNNRIRKVSTSGIITTVAGNGSSCCVLGDGGQATAALIGPSDVACDLSGNIYIADMANNRIRKVNSAGIISTYAGNGIAGYSGNGGQATSAELNSPSGIVIDALNNLYIADYTNNVIRKVNTSGVITTFAGNGTQGYSGDGSAANAAQLSEPRGVGIDGSGNLYIVEEGNQRIRKVTSSGNIYTVAGNGGFGGYSGDGGNAVSAALNFPIDVACDSAGNLYIADQTNYRIRMVSKPLTMTVNPATICAGGTATLTASGANTYSWSTSAITASISITPTITTQYTVTGTTTFTAFNTASFSTGALTPAVTVFNAVPTLSLSASSYTICNGGSHIISASGASTYTWIPATTLSNSNIANPTASPTTTTIYTVTGSNACGISAPKTVTATVNPIPTLSLTNNVYTICSGGSQIFTASGASSYTWSPATTLSNAHIANPTASPTTTTVYSVTGTNSSGCSNITAPLTITVTVTAPPSLNVSSNSYTICSGGSQTLSANGVNSYTWTPAATLSNPNIANPIASPTATTVYTVSGTATGCGSSSPITITVTVNTTPTVSIVGSSSQIVCAGATVSGITFTTSPAGSASWSNSNTLIGLATSGSGNIASYTAPTVTVQTLGVITASATVNGCTSSNIHYTLTINPLPGETGETITPSGCGSNNGTIIGATGTGGSTYSYQWNNTGGFVSSSSYTNGAGTYPLQIKDAVTGCIYSQNFTIPNAGAPPAPTIAVSATSACLGSTISFSVPLASGTIYNWTDATGGSGTGNTYTVSSLPTSPNPFTIMVTATYMGCISAASTSSVAVNALPNTIINSSTSQICQGSSTTLSVTPIGSYSYQWGNSSGIIPGSNAATLNVTTADIYSVTVTDNNTNCSASTSVNGTITINPLPAIDTTGIVITQSACNSPSGSINNVTITGSPTITYTWSSGGSLPSGSFVSTGSSSNATLSNAGAGIYCLNVIDGNACATNFCNIIVSNAGTPQAPVITASSTVACVGSAITFSVPIAVGITYSWTEADGNVGTGNTYAITNIPAIPNPYTVNATSTYMGCVSAATTFSFTVNTPPTISYTLTQDAAPQTWDAYPTYPANIASASWDWGDATPPTNSFYPSHIYAIAGRYNICVTVTDSNGCSSTYCQNDSVYRLANGTMVYVNVLPSQTTGISQISGLNSQISIYPNPNSGSFVVETNLSEKQTLQLYDVNGRMVLTQTIQGKTTINAGQLAEGIYNLSIISHTGIVNKRIVITH